MQQLIEYVFSCKIEGGIEGIFDYGAESITFGSEVYYSVNLDEALNEFNDTWGFLYSQPSDWQYTPFSSEEIRTFSQDIGTTGLDKDPSKDIMVRFGGLDWTVVCLSKNRDEEYVLTLWLSGNEQDAWQKESAYSQKGEYFGFVKSAETGKYGLYSDWSVDPVFEEGVCWPNYYATSYIRAVTLNNGGHYVVNGNDDIISGQFYYDPNSVFAEFTVPNSPLCEFIETPSNIAWQLNQYDSYGGMDNNYVNDYINEEIIVGEPINDRWYMDKLWLPSLAEVGDNTQTGIWNTSSAQRVNTDGSFLYPNNMRFSVVGSNNSNGSPAQPYTGCWLRTSDNSFNGDVYFNWEPSQLGSTTTHAKSNFSAAVRPALHLNLSKAVYNTTKPQPPGLENNTSSNESDPNIYMVETENGIDFHIKSADGFLKLSEATEKGWAFDPTWTFYLDNNITISANETYTPVGSEEHPFMGTFDGQGHRITFNFKYTFATDTGAVKPGYQLNFQDLQKLMNSHVALFGTIENAKIQNLLFTNSSTSMWAKIGGLIYQVKGNSSITNVTVSNNILGMGVCGLLETTASGSTCNLSHVTLQGSISGEQVNGVGIFSGAANLYDVNVKYTTFSADMYAYVFGFFGSSCIADSCRANVTLSSNVSTLGTLFSGKNLRINNVFADMTLPSEAKLEAFSGVQNLTCAESQLDLKFSSSPSNDPIIISEGSAGSINIYDCAFKCTGLTNLFGSSNNPSQGSHYYSGVYMTDGTKTTVLDPNFTSHKWCADPHLNDGMPQLRRFVSIGDFMEQCDMDDWAKAQ